MKRACKRILRFSVFLMLPMSANDCQFFYEEIKCAGLRGRWEKGECPVCVGYLYSFRCLFQNMCLYLKYSFRLNSDYIWRNSLPDNTPFFFYSVGSPVSIISVLTRNFMSIRTVPIMSVVIRSVSVLTWWINSPRGNGLQPLRLCRTAGWQSGHLPWDGQGWSRCSSGYLSLGDTLRSGNYTLRFYTRHLSCPLPVTSIVRSLSAGVPFRITARRAWLVWRLPTMSLLSGRGTSPFGLCQPCRFQGFESRWFGNRCAGLCGQSAWRYRHHVAFRPSGDGLLQSWTCFRVTAIRRCAVIVRRWSSCFPLPPADPSAVSLCRCP